MEPGHLHGITEIDRAGRWQLAVDLRHADDVEPVVVPIEVRER